MSVLQRILHFPWLEMLETSGSVALALQLFIASISMADNYIRVNHQKISDVLTYTLHKILPLWLQNKIRDSGTICMVADIVAYIMLPYGQNGPQSWLDFWTISNNLCRMRYGENQDQILEIFEPVDSSMYFKDLPLYRSLTSEREQRRGTLVFVHGGAWGCGRPWHYRLVANGLGAMLGVKNVVVVGYPTYPQTTILGQRDCVVEALKFIQQNQPVYSGDQNAQNNAEMHPITLCGHSSGANICALALLENVDTTLLSGTPNTITTSTSSIHTTTPTASDVLHPTALNVHTFIGLGGVYDIGQHYPFEANRGVHMVSPMLAAAGGRKCFPFCSPTVIVKGIFRRQEQQLRQLELAAGTTTAASGSGAGTAVVPGSTISGENNQRRMAVGMPHTVLIHGKPDGIVPLTSSEEFAAALRSIGQSAVVHAVKSDHMQPLDDCATGRHTPHSEVATALRRENLLLLD